MLGKVYFGWVEKGGLFLWISGDGWTFFKGGLSQVEMGKNIFWLDGGGWTFFMGWWRWVEIYFGRVEVSEHILWVEV